MRISAKIDYACRALLELALHWPDKTPLQISIIGKRQQIPTKFLTQILLNLKQLGYVNSIRGKAGGYLLTRAPRQLKLSDVVAGLGGLQINDTNAGTHVMDLIWQDVDDTVLESLKRINFEIIRERARSQEHVMMFGI